MKLITKLDFVNLPIGSILTEGEICVSSGKLFVFQGCVTYDWLKLDNTGGKPTENTELGRGVKNPSIWIENENKEYVDTSKPIDFYYTPITDVVSMDESVWECDSRDHISNPDDVYRDGLYEPNEKTYWLWEKEDLLFLKTHIETSLKLFNT